MKNRLLHKTLTYLIAAVWIINGLVCKVLTFVPRHKEIVERILGGESSESLTILIGFSEIVMGIWILTEFKSKLNAVVQMTLVTTMNILEFTLAPDLLLWGKYNLVFALLFIALVYYNEYVLNKRTNLKPTS